MGRQPWVVAPNWVDDLDPLRVSMLVQHGVSNNSAGLVLGSLIVFTLLYGALGVVWFALQRRYIREGPAAPGHDEQVLENSDDDKQLSFAY